jgi:hypothetical protein
MQRIGAEQKNTWVFCPMWVGMMTEITQADALGALGIKTGVMYTVVPVSCQQKDCIYNSDCQDNAVGLTAGDKGQFMICHDYKTDLLHDGSDRRVFWKRVSP